MDKDMQVEQRLLGADSEDSAFVHPAACVSERRSTLLLWSWVAQALLFAISLTTLVLANQVKQAAASSERCVEKLSPPSPALAAVSDEYELRRFMGTIGGDSQYMGRPTDERVQRWRDLQRSKSFGLSHEELVQLGAPESSVQLPAEEGGGYMAVLEVYHHIHCVEVLWKNTWPDYYDPEAGDADSLFRKHLDHCADIVRQKLMCDGDVTPLTFSWVKGISHPVPNFNALHKCRNFEDIRAWSREHAVQTDHDLNRSKPADAIELDDLP